MRGHGRSLDVDNRFTFAQSAQDILLLLDHLGIAHCKAIGDSGGGICLQLMASQQPQRFDNLVLIECASYFTAESRAAILAQFTAEAAGWEVWQSVHSRGVSQIRALLIRLPEILDTHNTQPPDLSKITAQTLIVSGDRGPFFSLATPLGMYAKIAHASLWVVPNAYHGFLLIDPSRHAVTFTPAVLQFLQAS